MFGSQVGGGVRAPGWHGVLRDWACAHLLESWLGEDWGSRPAYVPEDWFWGPIWADRAPGKHATPLEDGADEPINLQGYVWSGNWVSNVSEVGDC